MSQKVPKTGPKWAQVGAMLSRKNCLERFLDEKNSSRRMPQTASNKIAKKSPRSRDGGTKGCRMPQDPGVVLYIDTHIM